LLAADPKARFSVKATAHQLRLIRRGREEIEESDAADEDDDCEMGSDLNAMAPVSNPVVQRSLRVDRVGKRRGLNTEMEVGPHGSNIKNERSSGSCSHCFFVGVEVRLSMY
jgi:hypothetical protein